jgi:serine/threonine protein kinase
LGSGNFGEVYRGKWQGTTEVALKKLKIKEQMEKFIKEVSVLQYVFSIFFLILFFFYLFYF